MFTLPLYDDNPTTITPFVTWAIIGLCTIVFLWQASLPPGQENAVAYALGLVPAVLFGFATLPSSVALVPPEATLVTSMFLHGSWMHLFGNMLFLWIFGNNIEEALGHGRFLVFYLLCGIAAALGQALSAPGAETPMVGASGAIAGVLGAYLILYPHANVRTLVWFFVFVRLVNVPAWIMLGLWFAMQVLGGLSTPHAAGGVAFWAHVAGFASGIVLLAVLRRRGVALLQPARSEAFALAPPSEIGRRSRFGGGSVPPSGDAPWRRRGPWG
jgi:membrane associated rhomboid family serine protease